MFQWTRSLAVALVACQFTAFAGDDAGDFDITHFENQEIASGVLSADEAFELQQNPGDIGDIIDGIDGATVIIDRIINVGKKIWHVVEAGRPVVNLKADVATAMPEGISRWENLQGWNMPKWKMYKATYRNGFNSEVVSLTYRVLYTAGGNYKGKGKFLTNVTIVPTDVQVAWGFRLDAEASVPSVVNAGTSEEPLGQMELLMKWTVRTAVKHIENSSSFAVRGDGAFMEMN